MSPSHYCALLPLSLHRHQQQAWLFAGRTYRAPGIEPCLLALQDRHGLSVNLTLCLLYSWRVGRAVDLIAGRCCLEQHGEELERFRAKRRSRKVQLSQSAYQDLLAQELQLEQALQGHLLSALLSGEHKVAADDALADYLSAHRAQLEQLKNAALMTAV
ncbi:DUF2390 domain-containing protein [Aliagarivorans marinus]|uniref:DUF2390 domain-containing protein n=1 Tax=Aliagarivorans marinus TaxID=561965 RepID=UPI000688230D|nr:DUF2390 domain-containing protein [Aliagarivorans marinus]